NRDQVLSKSELYELLVSAPYRIGNCLFVLKAKFWIFANPLQISNNKIDNDVARISFIRFISARCSYENEHFHLYFALWFRAKCFFQEHHTRIASHLVGVCLRV